MASGVEELLDMLFEMIDEAKNAAFTSDKCVIERDRALDLIDDIRSQFPIELAESQKIMANRSELMASAKREAEAIRKAAEDKARQLLAEDVIALQGKQQAAELMRTAEERSRELKRAANEYCEDALRRTAVACYAAEGFYPPDVTYMQEHYGLQLNTNRFTVRYVLQASNLMPDITVLDKTP